MKDKPGKNAKKSSGKLNPLSIEGYQQAPYASAQTTRVPSIGPLINYYNFDIYAHLTTRYHPIVVRVTEFNDATQATGSITPIRVDGAPAPPLNIDRNDNTIWPHHPSTAFFPKPNNQMAILFVTDQFFLNFGLIKTDYVSGDPKWPATLGKPAAATFMLNFSRLYLPEVSTLLSELFKALGLPS